MGGYRLTLTRRLVGMFPGNFWEKCLHFWARAAGTDNCFLVEKPAAVWWNLLPCDETNTHRRAAGGSQETGQGLRVWLLAAQTGDLTPVIMFKLIQTGISTPFILKHPDRKGSFWNPCCCWLLDSVFLLWSNLSSLAKLSWFETSNQMVASSFPSWKIYSLPAANDFPCVFLSEEGYLFLLHWAEE